MDSIKQVENLPDSPCLELARYQPRVELWDDGVWTLTPGRTQLFPSSSYDHWPENSRPVPINASELLALPDARPSMLLIGCSYLAGDYLANPERLLFRLRARLSEGWGVSCVAASGGGLITNLAHISRFLPSTYQPDVVLIAPTQSWRQYIPESTLQFNSSPYGLWQHYYWFSGQAAKKQPEILSELCRRDCLRLDYLVDVMFPASIFLVVLFDSTGTNEIPLLRPLERELLSAWVTRHAPRVRLLFDQDEMKKWYMDLGPFDKKHPNARQIEAIASRVAELVK